MNKLQQISALQEQLAQQILTPEQLKEKARTVIRDARDTVQGSGYIGEEIKKVGDAYFDIPANLITKGPKACLQLLALHPLKATGTALEAVGGVAKDIAKIAVAPIPIALAGAQQSYNLARNTASGIVNTPIRAGRTVMNGCDRILNLFGPGAPSAPPPGKMDISSPGTPMAA